MRFFHNEINSSNTTVDGFDVESVLKHRYSSDIVAAIDSHLNELCNNGNKLDALNGNQKIFLLIGNTEKELNHGGFSNFYSSDLGNLSHEIEDALEVIGAYKTSQLFKDTNEKFPNGTVPANKNERINAMKSLIEEFGNLWEEYDEKFYMYEENFEGLLIEFLKNNVDSFRN